MQVQLSKSQFFIVNSALHSYLFGSLERHRFQKWGWLGGYRYKGNSENQDLMEIANEIAIMEAGQQSKEDMLTPPNPHLMIWITGQLTLPPR